MQYRERNCDSPAPKYGGKTCDGPTRENRSCSETECPGSFNIVYSLTVNDVKHLKRP